MRKQLGLLVLMALTGTGCRVVPSHSVSVALAQVTRRAPDGSEIRLRSLTNFAWTSFVAFGPYTTRAAADQSLGFAWPGFDNFAIQMSDQHTLLVFLAGDTVTHVEEHDRCSPDFAPDALGHRLSQESAVFTLRKSEGCDVLHMRSAVGVVLLSVES